MRPLELVAHLAIGPSRPAQVSLRPSGIAQDPRLKRLRGVDAWYALISVHRRRDPVREPTEIARLVFGRLRGLVELVGCALHRVAFTELLVEQTEIRKGVDR